MRVGADPGGASATTRPRSAIASSRWACAAGNGRSTPHGKLVNQPIVVDDTLEAIVTALGGDPSVLQGLEIDEPVSLLPVKEY